MFIFTQNFGHTYKYRWTSLCTA